MSLLPTRPSALAALALLVLSVAVSIASVSRRAVPAATLDILRTDATQYEAMSAHLIAHFPEEVGCAELTFQETSRYAVDAPESHAEWTLLWPSWSHAGFVRLGPAHRKLQVALYHELHCVHVLANALARTMGADEPRGHIAHCFDYLRRTFLCAADTALEPGDFLARDYARHPVGVTRACRDWSAVMGATEQNYRVWRNVSAHIEAESRGSPGS
ncbi:hypothetical protein PsYK624_079230 [Phanerochaete sordida]|uniref:Oxidase ustYa n=1 Tax=Phanerochaete sordida TaxID=48140 RepID=A0A9P3GBV4_9APHY|nr:hypothetical protein PsYK624_079230 [Phanerochaete sordida]